MLKAGDKAYVYSKVWRDTWKYEVQEVTLAEDQDANGNATREVCVGFKKILAYGPVCKTREQAVAAILSELRLNIEELAIAMNDVARHIDDMGAILEREGQEGKQ